MIISLLYCKGYGWILYFLFIFAYIFLALKMSPPQPEQSCSASPHVLKGRLKKYRFNRRGGVNQKAYQCIHCSFDFPFR